MKERQPDLFDIARERRDIGIDRVVTKADDVSPGWSDSAYAALCMFCKEQPQPFVVEEVRQWAEERGLVEAPHDSRAWGGIIQRAHRNLIVRKDGYAPTHSSNLSPKVRWAVL